MKITKINIPPTNGLQNIEMDRLCEVILLAGKNGSGKTRILNLIKSTLIAKPKKTIIETAKAHINHNEQIIKNADKSLDQLNHTLNVTTNEVLKINLLNTIAEKKETTKRAQDQSNAYQKVLNWDLLETSELSENYPSVLFVPKVLTLGNTNDIAKSNLQSAAAHTDKAGTDMLAQGTFAKIVIVQERYFNATHPEFKPNQDDIDKAIADYDRLQNIIEIFLGTRLGRTINGDSTLFDFPLGEAMLSDGQKILLQFCIALYSQEDDLKDLILFMDEPENHLHPAVIIEIIDRIKMTVPNGQIWIATHSVPLLAHFDPSNIWYVEKGKCRHAGKIPGQVLESLLGGEEQIAKLQDFIGLPAQYASTRYAFECLLPPTVVVTSANDPQSLQIREALLNRKNGSLKVLDYGAGKGRLISNLHDLEETSQEALLEDFDYIAFDKYPSDRDQCEVSLSKVYGSATDRYYSSTNDLYTRYDKQRFDVVILCNVLHEIDPAEWIGLFKEDGEISQMLAPNGVLLLIEDHQIPIGEKAYKNGFLVLDTPQLRDLFSITEIDKDFIFSDQRGDGRLKAHFIPREYLVRITADSKAKALKSMAKYAHTQIKEIRNKEQSYKNGKLHGFWTQQYANAHFNLGEIQ
ncbi:AAA family ATPase [Pedobacter hiemivivus]|uniref:Methyltransferase domain-containing protein n=1 Tax=Pedobacter hiemivivus TaxID=2530454 RepID=A0A4R0NFB5_9SPHI|nr:AAA family ATPase [Pedobacter hiemivivus]TCC99170.1 methyltransferase domain-containing protein [Pedobacter hiemivivus]